MEWFSSWMWLGLGIGLFLAEILAPGIFLLWIGIAALGVGGVTYFLPLTPLQQLILFSVFALISVIIGRKVSRASPTDQNVETLNNRGALYIGQVFEVSVAIQDGRGKAKVGDTQWIIEGPDTPKGARVKVIGTDGAILKVEPAED